MAILHDPYTWVIFSFILFVAVAFKFGWPALIAGLDAKIKVIKNEVDAAERLRAEANALLLEFEQRQRDAEREADNLVAQARLNAEQVRIREEERLNDVMKRKEQQLVERVALLRDQTIAELRQVAADLAFDATAKMVKQTLDADSRARLIDRALEQVEQSFDRPH